MLKLLIAYNADKSLTNARKIHAYGIKHPMALCLLVAEDLTTYREATDHAARGKARWE